MSFPNNKSQKEQYDQYNLTLMLTVLIVLQAVLAIIIFFIPPFSALELNQKINIFLSWAIVQFTIIGAISTWLQYAVAEKRNKIDDSRFELETVYGPLFTFLSSYKKKVNDTDEPLMNSSETSFLNNIFSTYPHIISNKLYNYWKEKIHNVDPDFIGHDTVYYHIPIEFVDEFIAEYEGKVNTYRKLLNKR